ncbi:MAG TPA: glycosyltransferase family 4 protein [Croceibacterium sp.]|nr:glycosyltransferase family 4 protein [Propylenella sp.]HYD25596.1 glycosyltransferase family 4 protein [Croceibacterium sp.]
MKVLYIGGVGPFGGASRSLYEAVGALPPGSVEPVFLMPRGTALDFYRRVASDTLAIRGVSRFDHTRAAHYRGVRWIVVLRELSNLPSMLLGLRRARRRWPDIDLIHVNEFTEIIPGLLAKRLFGVPLVVHVRSLVHTDAKMRRTRWLHKALAQADAIVAIDETVRGSLPAELNVNVIHNSFTSNPTEKPDDRYLAQFDRLRPNALKVGFVGNLLRTKGIVELVRAARMVKDRGGDVQYIIIGGGIASERSITSEVARRLGLAQTAEEEVRRLIADLGLEQEVFLFGPTADIQRTYSKMDVLAFPSHLDSPGRPVFEAGFFGVPSIVAVRHPLPDTIIDKKTGIAIAEPHPVLIADAILEFERDRSEVRRMGDAARALAERNYLPELNATKLLQLYWRILERRSSGDSPPQFYGEHT